jgi:predicted N-acetyltransferase YhbS
MTTIRNLRRDEFDPFMRFLERCYRSSPGTFERLFPHLYRPAEALCSSAYLVEVDGRIVSHVGLYPIELVVHDETITVGGIGGVATLHAERGKGHMTRLLYHAIDEMRERGYPMSWLGGDRQRYNAFGWERAGLVYELGFSRRSLDRAGVTPAEIEARFPRDAVDVVARLQSQRPYRVRRPELALQLQKDGLWIWVADDAYVLVHDSTYEPLSIAELVSTSGQECGIVRAALDGTGRNEISWIVPAWEHQLLARIMPAVARWRVGGWQMYRIVDLARLLSLLEPVLSARAGPLHDFALSLGIREHDRTDAATLVVRGGRLEIRPGREADRYVEWSPQEAVRALLGGAPLGAGVQVPLELAALLPLPVHVPALDYV